MITQSKSGRRRAPRLELDVSVNHILTTDVCLPAALVNLSRSGLAIESDGVSTPSSIRFAWLQFALPNGTRIRALGERIYESRDVARKLTHGYRFKYIAPRERVALNEFMAEQEAADQQQATHIS